MVQPKAGSCGEERKADEGEQQRAGDPGAASAQRGE
jgi:hypothetical protein